ncbi:nitrate reductase [Rhizobium sp. R72]|uniref:SUMF1/EgtB/PvdO family nonheme iron enzyme n=1 Tax=unclassified Rhizobium TaxID=2613769 RepID=UPI000B52AF88|nr:MULTISPECIES: SUMF1/EgtB/PvdO family nonheme iron enzyme [unclassified Rhizobium]OWV97102.1 nitrate reductase [Rhizobium sp. R72]OWV97125.1 nitrate reductase [Rhizobium sp. R711]
MARNAATEAVSGISIAVPLALLAILSGAVAVESGFVVMRNKGATVASPVLVIVEPQAFAYREATEYFRHGLAIDAPKREIAVRSRVDITKFQTTLGEYNRCVDDGICSPAEGRDSLSREDIPVTGVSYDDAVRYAAWLSDRTGEDWRLPTDFELAYAAADRFPDDALGIDIDDNNPATRWLADYEREARRAASIDPRPQAKGSFGTSKTGLVDFGGNVWEWTSTCNKRVDLDSGAKPEEPDPRTCGIMIASGRHRSPMSSFVRNPKGGGCTVGSPPDNLGFRLVRRQSFLESVREFARKTAADTFGLFVSAPMNRSHDEG